jgi:hypothetical protein
MKFRVRVNMLNFSSFIGKAKKIGFKSEKCMHQYIYNEEDKQEQEV